MKIRQQHVTKHRNPIRLVMNFETDLNVRLHVKKLDIIVPDDKDFIACATYDKERKSAKIWVDHYSSGGFELWDQIKGEKLAEFCFIHFPESGTLGVEIESQLVAANIACKDSLSFTGQQIVVDTSLYLNQR